MSEPEGPKAKVDGVVASITSGYRYCVTLHPTTPLQVLSKAGEFCPLDKPCPYYGDESVGIWSPVTKSLAEILGKKPRIASADSMEWKEESVASFLGPVRYKTILAFLMAFRAIIEGNSSLEAKKAAIRELCEQSNANEEIKVPLTERMVEHLLSYCK